MPSHIKSMSFSTIIKSAHNGTTLEFFDRESDYFKIRICGSDFQGAILVYSFEPTSSGLTSFFRDLAVHWRGWQGKKEWSSLEGELKFAATSDSTGHISLSVQIRQGAGSFGWLLSAVLLIEAGNLEQLTHNIEKIFEDGHVA
jgi:hypothetical protein